jgi:hypothetical protein
LSSLFHQYRQYNLLFNLPEASLLLQTSKYIRGNRYNLLFI